MPIVCARTQVWMLTWQSKLCVIAELLHERDEEAAERDTARIADCLRRYDITPTEISPNFRLPSPHRIRVRVLAASINDAVLNGDQAQLPDSAFVELEAKAFRALDPAIAWTDGLRERLLGQGFSEVE